MTFGESHGVALGCVIDNCPAGLALTETDVQPDLNRRRPGQSNITTPRSEEDRVSIVSGTFEGRTIGSPICMIVQNTNAKAKDYSDFRDVYRPSHADYTTQARYGYRSHVGGARASARSTIGVVAAGAVAKKILSEKAGVKIAAFVSRIHHLKTDPSLYTDAAKIRSECDRNDVRCPDQSLAAEMVRHIQDVRQQGDSLGGIVSLLVENVPPGWGAPVARRLDARLADVMMAIPATKGVEVGSGFAAPDKTGSEHNDLFYMDEKRVKTRKNDSGGIQGGISNGMPITMNIAFKPTATISREQMTVNEAGQEVPLKVKGRHDPCVLPRAVPIVEAMAALVLVDEFLLSRAANYTLL